MRHHNRIKLIALAGGVCSAGVSGEPPRAVDQGVVDTNPLAKSLWHMPMDLRTPTGFERVYEVQTRDGQTQFMRVSGGLHAVFPRSQYVRTQSGSVALIPADTVFVIGDPGFGTGRRRASGDQHPAAISSGFGPQTRADTGLLDLRVGSGASDQKARSLRTPVTPPSVRPVYEATEGIDAGGDTLPWGDHSDRSYRLASLMARAASAEAVVAQSPELSEDLLDALFGE